MLSIWVIGWIGSALAVDSVVFKDNFTLTGFYRGAIHAHSSRGDGDTPAVEVVQWYSDHGFDFMALTDHNVWSKPITLLPAVVKPGFRIIPGEEVSWIISNATNPRKIPVHVTGLCTSATIGYKEASTARSSALKKIIHAIHEQGGIAIVNHPNFDWALELADLGPVDEPYLLEIHNGQYNANNAGGLDKAGDHHPSTEAIWDTLTNHARDVYAVAADDAHDFKKSEKQLGFPPRAPGTAWIELMASAVTPLSVCDSLKNGKFYSTTGVQLNSIAVDGDQFAIAIKPAPKSEESQYVTEFIGNGGKVFMTKKGFNVAYRLRGSETYIRARITRTDGTTKTVAWTQPVRVITKK